jgi:hypothetical protein
LRESLPSVEEAGDLAATRFDREVSQVGVVAVGEGHDKRPPAQIVGAAKDAAVRGAVRYVGGHAEFIDPVGVERKIVVDVQDLGIEIVGVVDLISAGQGGGHEIIRDLKAPARAPRKNEAHESSQLSMYSLLRSLETGQPPGPVALDHVVIPSNGSPPWIETQYSERTPEDLDVMAARLSNAIEATRGGVFLANGVGTWVCSPRWCEFYSTCRFVSKGHND